MSKSVVTPQIFHPSQNKQMTVQSLTTNQNKVRTEVQPTYTMKTSAKKSILQQSAIPVLNAMLSDQIQLTDIKTGKNFVKTIDKTKITISAFDPASKSLRPVGITPKQNYSTVDHVLVNLYGHKGPDEPSNDSGVMPI